MWYSTLINGHPSNCPNILKWAMMPKYNCDFSFFDLYIHVYAAVFHIQLCRNGSHIIIYVWYTIHLYCSTWIWSVLFPLLLSRVYWMTVPTIQPHWIDEGSNSGSQKWTETIDVHIYLSVFLPSVQSLNIAVDRICLLPHYKWLNCLYDTNSVKSR